MDVVTRQSEYESFKPEVYLREYYLEVGPENQFLIDSLASAYKDFADSSLTILEVGGGPTVYQLVSSARVAKELHFTDFAPGNLKEIEKWRNNQDGCFNWDKFVAAGLEAEGKPADMEAVKARSSLMRNKITRVLRYDLLSGSLPETGVAAYDLVSSVFSTDAIAHSLDEWKSVLKNISALIRKDGWLVLIGVLGSDSWVMGNETYKATNLDEKTIRATMDELGYDIEMLEIVPAEEGNEHGYDGVFCMKAKKN